jgi:hypothetical protein
MFLHNPNIRIVGTLREEAQATLQLLEDHLRVTWVVVVVLLKIVVEIKISDRRNSLEAELRLLGGVRRRWRRS